MKITIILLGLCLAPFSVFAAENEIINDNMQQVLNQTNAEMMKSAEEMNKTLQQVMPQVAESMSQFMSNFLNTLPTVMKAAEENQVFSKASSQMNKDFQKSMQELNQEIDQQLPPTIRPQTIPAAGSESEQLMITGSRNENGKAIDFAVTQNPETIQQTTQMLEKKAAPSSASPAEKLNTLKGKKISLNNFKIEIINGNNFLISDSSEETYATGNIGSGMNIQVQTSGPNAAARARNFITNFNKKF